MQKFISLEKLPPLERINPRAVWTLAGLLIGLGVGYILPSLERKTLTLETQPLEQSLNSRTGFARNACAGRPIPRVDGGWAVVYGDEEC